MSDSESKNLENSPYHYAVLMETNGKEYESWYYFIRYEGNEEALQHLSKQIESVDFYVLDELSTFDLDLEHLVSEKTAKEMTKLELNAYMFHRKFDGKLEMIDIGLKKKDKNDKKIVRFFEKLGIGRVDDYVDGEDIDPEDLASDHSNDASDNSNSDTDYNYEISESESEEETKKKKKKRRNSSDTESESDTKERSPKIDKRLDKLKKKMR